MDVNQENPMHMRIGMYVEVVRQLEGGQNRGTALKEIGICGWRNKWKKCIYQIILKIVDYR